MWSGGKEHLCVCTRLKKILHLSFFELCFCAYLSSWGPYNLAGVRCRVWVLPPRSPHSSTGPSLSAAGSKPNRQTQGDMRCQKQSRGKKKRREERLRNERQEKVSPQDKLATQQEGRRIQLNIINIFQLILNNNQGIFYYQHANKSSRSKQGVLALTNKRHWSKRSVKAINLHASYTNFKVGVN